MALTTRTDGLDPALGDVAAPTLPVGAELRARRLANKADLAQIANQLRIRATFLEAIEEMDYKRLPGLPYAIGFVRTYADFLGFDAAEMVARFKSEAAGIEARAPLVFPSPAPQGKVPGPLPLTLALVVAVGIAATWYFWRDGVSDLVARVPEVPERLAALTKPAEKPPVEPPPVQAAAPAQPTDAVPAEESVPQPPTSVPAEPTSAPAAAQPDSPPAVATLPSPPPAPAPTTSVAPAQPLPAFAVPPPVPEAKPAKPTAAAKASTATNDIATSPEGGKIYGAQNQAGRIVVKAHGDSWLQVRDKDSQVLLTRVLHDGDSYRVPDGQGMQMSVGNAGAVELVVDGKTAPSLGPAGVSRRAILLDPERLSKGIATSR